MPLQAGARLGAYELLSLIGAGGMGEVYRARDLDLERIVAIKVLREKAAIDAARLTRFEREARLASSLNHPHIITIYHIGHAGPLPYIVMELVEGETLAAIMAQGSLPLARAVDIAAQIADGLAQAHRAGIVHRDIKPQNVMVRHDGLVKLLDFGLSTLTAAVRDDAVTMAPGASLTESGAILGTTAYMSPEQASGRQADFRTDQFSFGSTLYEMVTARRAFARPTAVQTLSAIIEDTPEPIREIAPDLPEQLHSIVERCLSKDPTRRFAATEDLAHDLQTVREHLSDSQRRRPPTAVRRAPQRGRKRVTGWVAVGILASAAALLTIPAVRERLAAQLVVPPDAARQQLAILPFVNLSGDASGQVFSDGLVEILSSQLTQISRPGNTIDIVPASEVRKEGVASARDARRVFGVSRVLTGSVMRTATHVRVTLNLVDAQTLRQMSARSIDLELQDVAAMQDGVVREVARLVGAPVGTSARQALALGGTSVPAAYDAYIQARGHLQRYEKPGNVDAAIDAFRRSVALDPRFALGHAGLGEAYWRKYELSKDPQSSTAARASCATAVGLADSLAPVYVTLGLIDAGTGRYEEAVDDLKRALALDPLNDDAHRELANAFHTLARTAEAEASFKAAIEVRPTSWANHNALGRFYFRLSRYDEAAAQFQRVIDLVPDHALGYSSLGAVYYATKRYDEAARTFERSASIQPNYAAYSNLGTLNFTLHRYTEAARVLEKALKFNDRDSLVWSNLATSYYWASGERDKARPAYEQALALAEQESRVNPRSATLLLRMADCRSRLGEPARAREDIERALGIAKDDANLLFRAGEVYEQLGDRARALTWIRTALKKGYPRDLVERSPGLAQLRADPRFSAP